jgi:hypothetical protein
MANSPAPVAVATLAAVHEGDDVQVKQFLFDGVRSLCRTLGLYEGDVVHCRSDAPSWLVLETPGGRTVVLERGWARFIEVGSAGQEAKQ